VVLHALADAPLVRASHRRHFPNTDPRYKGISSLILLGQVADLLRKHRFAVVNADITVLLEFPKIASHVDRMRGAIARALDVTPEQVSIKDHREGWPSHRRRRAAYAAVLLTHE
jgi:2-C-methyl-D-erythritol 2,4-cyclodiphosphate synthase